MVPDCLELIGVADWRDACVSLFVEADGVSARPKWPACPAQPPCLSRSPSSDVPRALLDLSAENGASAREDAGTREAEPALRTPSIEAFLQEIAPFAP